MYKQQLQSVKNVSIFAPKSFLLVRAPLKEAKHGIGSCVSFVLLVINTKVISWELLGLADLTKTQTFYIRNRITKVTMVDKYKNFILAAL